MIDYEYIYMFRQGSEEARKYIIKKFDRLLWKTSFNLYASQRPQGIQVIDLYQEGIVGLIEAVFCFREDMEVGFAHYVSICVETHIRSALRKCRSNSYRLLDTSNSLDMNVAEDNSLTRYDVIGIDDPRLDPAYQAMLSEGRVLLNKVLGGISVEERSIYDLWIEGYSYREIADKCNSTSKFVDNTLQKIKKLLMVV